MNPLADPADVKAVSPSLTPEQESALPGLLRRASTLIRGWGVERGIDIDQYIADDPLRIEIVRTAVAEAAKRAATNLDAIYETTTRIDDFTATERRDRSVSGGAVYIDEADLKGLLPRARSRFGTLPMGAAL